MPDTPELRITTRVDLTGLSSGMQGAQQVVTDASAQMQAAFSSVEEATTALKQAQAELADILKQAGGSIDDNNAMWGLYQQTLQRVADAQAQVSAANSAVADSTAIATNAWHSATTTSEQFGAAARQSTLSLAEQQAALDSFIAREEAAAAVTRELEASITALVEQTLTVPPAMQAAANASYMAANAWSADTITSEEFGAATQQVTLSLEEQQAAMREFAAQAEEDAAATQALVDAAFELIAVNTQEAAATSEVTAATNEAAAATNRFGDMQAYVAARSIAMAAGLEQEGFLFGMMARSVPALAAVMDAVFPVAIAASFAYVIADLVGEFEQWYERTQELKKAMSDLIDVNVDLRNQNESAAYRLLQQEAAQAKLNGQTELYQKLVQQMVPLTAASVGLKIPQKDLDDLHNAGLDVRTLVNELQNAHHLGDLQGLEKPLQSATQQIQQWIAKTSAQIKQDTDRAAAEAQAAMGGGVAAGAVAGTDNVDEALKKRLATAQQLLQTLQQTQTLISTETQAANLDGQDATGKLAGQHQHVLDQAANKIADGWNRVLNVDQQYEKNLQEQRVRWIISTRKQTLDEIGATSDEITSRIATLAGNSAEFQKLTTQSQASQNRDALGFEDELMRGIGVRSRMINADFERTVVEPGRKIAAELRQHWDQAFATIGRTFDQSVQGIIMGTETISMAWRRMGANLLVSFADTMAQMVLKAAENEVLHSVVHAAGVQTRVAATAAGATEETGIGLMTTLKRVTQEAVKAASGAYSAMASIPIVGPELGAIAAAATFTAVEGLGALASAAGGYWRVPDNMLANIHRDEMVLPSNMASGMRSLIENNQTGAGGGENHLHVNVQAIDSRSFMQTMRTNEGEFIAYMRDLFRRGRF